MCFEVYRFSPESATFRCDNLEIQMKYAQFALSEMATLRLRPPPLETPRLPKWGCRAPEIRFGPLKGGREIGREEGSHPDPLPSPPSPGRGRPRPQTEEEMESTLGSARRDAPVDGRHRFGGHGDGGASPWRADPSPGHPALDLVDLAGPLRGGRRTCSNPACWISGMPFEETPRRRWTPRGSR